FGRESETEPPEAGEVATRAAEAGDKALLHRVTAHVKNDWNGRSRRFGRQRRGGASCRKHHRDLAANQIVRHVSKPVVIAPGRAMFESNILAHNVAGFIEALAECINHVRENLRLPAA